MKKVAVGEVCLRLSLLSPDSIIRPPLHTRIHPHTSLLERRKGQAWKCSKKHCSFENLRALDGQGFHFSNYYLKSHMTLKILRCLFHLYAVTDSIIGYCKRYPPNSRTRVAFIRYQTGNLSYLLHGADFFRS